MTINEFNSVMENWSSTCGRPSIFIGLLQIAVIAFTLVISFKVKKIGLRKYLTFTSISSIVPVICGAIFYWMGSRKGEKALRLVEPTEVEQLRANIHLEAISCLLGSMSYLILLLPILIVTTILYSVIRPKYSAPIQ